MGFGSGRRDRLGRWGAVALVGGLAACAAPPPPPTVVDASISASKDANAGSNGAGEPVAIRLYQLVSPAGFQGAQFFELFDKDKDKLGPDLVKRDDLLLAPGQSKDLALKPDDRAHAIGVFAGYRDYEHVTWRAVVDIPAHATSTLKVTLGKSGVAATIEPAKPAS